MFSFSLIKTWLIGILAVSVSIFAFLWKSSQLGRIKDKVKGIKRARKTEKAASDALAQGLQNETKGQQDVQDNFSNGSYNPFK